MNRRKAIKKTGLMAGAAVMLPSLVTLLQSCKSEPRLDWQPSFFKVDEAQFISKLIDIILPRTETPGGLDVKADIFLDKIFAQTYDEVGQQKIRTDIAEFNANCKKKFGDTFIGLSNEKQVEVLKAAEANSGKFNGGVWGTAVGKQEPCLLYTSPSPRDATLSRMPSSA